jgi:hypothetical protein
MNSRYYPHPKSKGTRPEEQVLRIIHDGDRAKFLLDHGYLPRFIATIHSEFAIELVNWAIRNQHCPSYWREPRNNWEKSHAATSGAFCYKAGDRERIDQCILEKL